MVRRRLKVLMLLLTVPFLAILGRLWSIQVDLDGHVRYRLEAQRRSLILVSPRRGRILDRYGRVLAQNEANFDLYFVYRQLNPRSAILKEICRILSRFGSFPSPAEVDEHLRSLVDPAALGTADGVASDELLLLIENVPPPAARHIESVLKGGGPNELFVLLPSPLGGGYQDLWVKPREVLRMELTLERLSRRIPDVSRADLLRHISVELDRLEARVEDAVERARQRGWRERELADKAKRDLDTYLKQPWRLVSNVGLDVVTAVEYRRDLYPGIEVVDGTRRHYPLGEAAAALVGRLRPLHETELKPLKEAHGFLDHPSFSQIRSVEAFKVLREGGLRHDDLKGACGLEASYDVRLRGTYGARIVRVDKRGRPFEELESLAPEPGEDLRTTLDAALQELLYRRLTDSCQPSGLATAGSVVVLEVPSGAVLASVGYPALDPNRFRETGYVESLAKRPGIYLDRPRLERLYPGSVFKLITAVAGFESGHDWNGPVDPERRYPCRLEYEFSSRLHCRDGHSLPGGLNLKEGLQYSCNSYFFYLAHKHLTPDALYAWARHFGFGRPTGIDLPAHSYAAGELRKPRRAVAAVGQFSIGQVYVQATALQVGRAVASIAMNCQSLPTPFLVEPRRAAQLPPLKPTTVAAIVEGMRRAATQGTAAREEFGLRRFRLAAKTGTAQYATTGDRYHAWLAGFAPLPEPKIAFVVVLEKTPEHGGEACAPLAEALLNYLAEKDSDFLVEGREGNEG